MLQVSRTDVDLFFNFCLILLSLSYNHVMKTFCNKKNCWKQVLSALTLAKAFSSILELLFTV